MAYWTNYYSQSTGEHRHVCVPTPASQLRSLVPYQPMPLVPYQGPVSYNASFAPEASPKVDVVRLPTSLHEPLGPIGFQPSSPTTADASSFTRTFQPKPYCDVMAGVNASRPIPAAPLNISTANPALGFTSSSLGLGLTCTSPTAPTEGWWRPPTFEDALAYQYRSQEPLLNPISSPPSEFNQPGPARVVGRVQRSKILTS
eukprot:NODE_1756_length_766_cov_324.383543_g1364_i0.p1 GENE.NODE_1756_length_766_cov_324.383543_g1364_i0~~NODE_1756_length_766_cov_324.383543_g1364_i0.p1  ORF type:complete len:219 (+),score=43.90 NODE_1756_length_766_cov_324.383543_g1364_i0:56-658(+)